MPMPDLDETRLIEKLRAIGADAPPEHRHYDRGCHRIHFERWAAASGQEQEKEAEEAQAPVSLARFGDVGQGPDDPTERLAPPGARRARRNREREPAAGPPTAALQHGGRPARARRPPVSLAGRHRRDPTLVRGLNLDDDWRLDIESMAWATPIIMITDGVGPSERVGDDLDARVLDAYHGLAAARVSAATASGGPRTVRREPKVGRNEPCSYGSGKKYKKCCLRASN